MRPLQHGTLTAFRYCKCEPCRTAKRAYMLAYMRRRRGPPRGLAPLPAHGQRARYQRGCRCPACKAAHTTYMQAYREEKRWQRAERREQIAAAHRRGQEKQEDGTV